MALRTIRNRDPDYVNSEHSLESVKVDFSRPSSEIDTPDSWYPKDEYDGEDEDLDYNKLQRFLIRQEDKMGEWWKGLEKFRIDIFVKLVVILLLGAYVVAACIIDIDRAWPAIVLYCSLLAYVFFVIVDWVLDKNEEKSGKSYMDEVNQWLGEIPFVIRLLISIVFYLLLLGGFIAASLIYNKDTPRNLISAAGLLAIILISVICSKSPARIRWRPVFWGLALQYLFALFVLRTQVGFDIFDWLGSFVQDFLDLSMEGISFVFAPAGMPMPWILAINVLMVITYFSAVISCLYHFGVMQLLVSKIALIMQFTMNTSATESMSAAGNIFVGQTEAPLLVRPYLETMTLSELHAIMTGGFATIAGAVFASYVAMGISASHLISASVMSAPAALAISKIVYPETEKSPSAAGSRVQKIESPYENFIHALAAGARSGMDMVLYIIANLIAFISILAAINVALEWFGSLVEIEDLSLELISQYLFYPLAFLMGADEEDCLKVGELIGLKTVVNEFVAYDRLKDMISRDEISKRSELIATYALCGFSNLASIGIQIGGLGAVAPGRQADLAKLGWRSFIAGSLACFATACIAGLLYDPDEFQTVYSDGAAATTTEAVVNTTISTAASLINSTILTTADSLINTTVI